MGARVSATHLAHDEAEGLGSRAVCASEEQGRCKGLPNPGCRLRVVEHQVAVALHQQGDATVWRQQWLSLQHAPGSCALLTSAGRAPPWVFLLQT